MQLYRFDESAGKSVVEFGSSGAALAPIARPNGMAQVGCFYLAPGGRIGYHQATTPQLFLVVRGEGVVQGDGREVPVLAGTAIFWDTSEWHEVRSDTGLVAIVVEAERLDPGELMEQI
jgi:quercetin dioxygenase-like cupin family protein